jgi:hypothetical protein
MRREAAQTLALEALAFLAEEPTRLAHFLALTGLALADLRQRAGSGELGSAVLEHLAADESLLLTFAQSRAIAPQSILLSLALLQAERHERK